MQRDYKRIDNLQTCIPLPNVRINNGNITCSQWMLLFVNQKIRKYVRIDVYMSSMAKHIFSKNLPSLQLLSGLEIIQLEALF